jgi:hypothetical protein
LATTGFATTGLATTGFATMAFLGTGFLTTVFFGTGFFFATVRGDLVTFLAARDAGFAAFAGLAAFFTTFFFAIDLSPSFTLENALNITLQSVETLRTGNTVQDMMIAAQRTDLP